MTKKLQTNINERIAKIDDQLDRGYTNMANMFKDTDWLLSQLKLSREAVKLAINHIKSDCYSDDDKIIERLNLLISGKRIL